jgi:DtxR family Mn-dependent transcriptional regulator
MTESLENYLESIYFIIRDKKVARVKDIAEDLNVKKPSVINAIKELKSRGLVEHEKYGYIELTEKGMTRSKEISEKHGVLTHFFRDILQVSSKTAEEDACKMEHILSDESWKKLKKFIKEQD